MLRIHRLRSPKPSIEFGDVSGFDRLPTDRDRELLREALLRHDPDLFEVVETREYLDSEERRRLQRAIADCFQWTENSEPTPKTVELEALLDHTFRVWGLASPHAFDKLPSDRDRVELDNVLAARDPELAMAMKESPEISPGERMRVVSFISEEIERIRSNPDAAQTVSELEQLADTMHRLWPDAPTGDRDLST